MAEVAQAIEQRLPHLNASLNLSSYHGGDDKYLRGTWGAGSRRTDVRKNQKRRKLAAAAAIPSQQTIDTFFGIKSQRHQQAKNGTLPQTLLQTGVSACTQATIYGFAPEDLRTAVEIIDGNIKALRRGCRPYETMQQIAVRLF